MANSDHIQSASHHSNYRGYVLDPLKLEREIMLSHACIYLGNRTTAGDHVHLCMHADLYPPVQKKKGAAWVIVIVCD